MPFHRYADGHDLADLALEQVAGLPEVVLERLTNFAALPAVGFAFTAVPPRLLGAATFTVRAFATT